MGRDTLKVWLNGRVDVFFLLNQGKFTRLTAKQFFFFSKQERCFSLQVVIASGLPLVRTFGYFAFMLCGTRRWHRIVFRILVVCFEERLGIIL